jgi:hypothetical protein
MLGQCGMNIVGRNGGVDVCQIGPPCPGPAVGAEHKVQAASPWVSVDECDYSVGPVLGHCSGQSGCSGTTGGWHERQHAPLRQVSLVIRQRIKK